jgi:3-hydroxyacyl-[acyl-carrier-protein] dehydratase
VADIDKMQQVLDLIPQQFPFRFIDDILEVNNKAITAVYQFRTNEYFYAGHFPGNPITPGVILIEAMAQTGVVALGIYLLLDQGLPVEELKQMTSLFAFADEIEFTGIVRPGEKVMIRGEKVYLRKGILKTRVNISRESCEIVCSGILTGTGVGAF